jgi:osmotically-inducible protein OsmY
MKKHILLLALTLASSTAILHADSITDRRIEGAAQSTYNFRVVLDNRVHVKANDGVVTLTGTVQDRGQKVLAENTISSLPGVTRVDNQIAVGTQAPEHSDDWIALKIRGMLLVKANVSVTDTKVAVQNGVVTLTGTADNTAQKELTEAYVRDIEGVQSVKNNIEVRSAGEPARRSVGEVVDDSSITAQVKYALLTHRSTSALSTSVETRDGDVVIRGEADSDAERDLVTKLARSIRGVKDVKNEMTVGPRR